MKRLPYEAAFPNQSLDAQGMPTNPMQEGLTLREYFAARAMQGMMSNPSIIDQFKGEDRIAKHAFVIADAMIKAGGE